MKPIDNLKSAVGKALSKFIKYNNNGFNANKYWAEREIAIHSNKSFIRKAFAVRYVNKINTRFCASIYTEIGNGCIFETSPILPHQLNGIVIASTAHIGKNATILQQVTIGGNPPTFDGTSPISQAAIIGDNVIIGSGAKLIGNIHIGNNVSIGANAVVITDIPDNCIAVGVPALSKPKKGKINENGVND